MPSPSPTTCCAGACGWRIWMPCVGLHGRPGGGADPEPDGGGRRHAALRRGGRDRADGVHQRGAVAVVAGACPRPAGAGGVHRCGHSAGAHAGREQGRDGHLLQRGGGLPPAGCLAAGEVLYLVYLPGNVPRHTDAAEWIDRSIALVATHAKRVCVRGDTDFSLTVNFDRRSKEADFIFGYDARS